MVASFEDMFSVSCCIDIDATYIKVEIRRYAVSPCSPAGLYGQVRSTRVFDELVVLRRQNATEDLRAPVRDDHIIIII